TLLTPPGATTLYASPVSGYTSPSAASIASGQAAADLVYAQNATLSGTLQDDIQRLAGVTVTIVSHVTGGAQTRLTDANGRFSIQLPVGTYDVSVGAVNQHVSAAPQ